MSILDDVKPGDNALKASAADLRKFCEEIERLKDEQKELGAQISDVKRHAKQQGYDPKTLAEMLKLRALGAAERQEREALRELYGRALGIFD